MNLIALPAFTDNYIWMLHDGARAMVVDPGDAAPVQAALRAGGLTLAGILVTHHHGDHVGGVDALRSTLDGAVYAPAGAVAAPAVTVADGDRIELLGCSFDVLAVPGHTLDHLAYVQAPSGDEPPCLFCGDALFSAGCGRLFEGTAAQLHASLERLAALPDDTRVCCGHEYTLANLRFAADVEPRNAAIAEHDRACRATRALGRPTLPSRIGLERQINPFLRCSVPDVVRAARDHGATGGDPAAVFAGLRRWKNDHR